MSPISLEVQILIGVFLTSFLSGFLGMGGGMILMALYTGILPVKLAMILHGVTQFSANGFRAHLHRSNIKWKIVTPYLIAAACTFFIFKFMNFVPSKGVIYILLGSFPFVSFLPALSRKLNMTDKGRPIICGVLVTTAQILAGASGAVLDVFFVHSHLNRYQVIATKAVTQSIGHMIKLIYYGLLITSANELSVISLYTYPGVIIAAYIGTNSGKLILDRLSEHRFKKISQYVILALAVGLLIKGIHTLLHTAPV